MEFNNAINLSILDFKDTDKVISYVWRDAINLSILDFKESKKALH